MGYEEKSIRGIQRILVAIPVFKRLRILEHDLTKIQTLVSQMVYIIDSPDMSAVEHED